MQNNLLPDHPRPLVVGDALQVAFTHQQVSLDCTGQVRRVSRGGRYDPAGTVTLGLSFDEAGEETLRRLGEGVGNSRAPERLFMCPQGRSWLVGRSFPRPLVAASGAGVPVVRRVECGCGGLC